VTVEVNANAASLPAGAHVATIHFTDLTNHMGDASREVVLAVGERSVRYEWTLDTNPGWTTQGQWAWGHPTGGGGQYGGPDPTSGHTGSNVYGYNLSGDYPNSMPQYNLTTGPIDMTDLLSVHLKFWRWLGVEQGIYDHASVRVSADGSTWTTVWENPANSSVEDAAWYLMDLDISPVASDEPTVYLQWTMGTTDGGWHYCGWNIDDIQILGIEKAATEVPGGGPPASGFRLDPVSPNPFNPSTIISFSLSAAGPADLSIYDVSGRLVTTLASGEREAGPGTVRWDGRDSQGIEVGSGVYFVRLNAAGSVATRKMVLVK
jgi:hypothetical protein